MDVGDDSITRDTPIHKLKKLSTITLHALTNADIKTVADLMNCNVDYLNNIPLLGKVGILRIQEALQSIEIAYVFSGQYMKLLLATIAIFFFAGTAHAQYRCVENGKTMLTDRPCASEQAQSNQQPQGKTNNVIGDVANSAYATTTGGWRGQAQYQANVGGVISQEAHAVVPMTIEIDPQGKILGSSPENGCKIKGLATPGVMATISNIDVTFSGCAYTSFNRRMSGTLAIYPAQKYAQFGLYAISVGIGKVAESFDIRATLCNKHGVRSNNPTKKQKSSWG